MNDFIKLFGTKGVLIENHRVRLDAFEHYRDSRACVVQGDALDVAGLGERKFSAHATTLAGPADPVNPTMLE